MKSDTRNNLLLLGLALAAGLMGLAAGGCRGSQPVDYGNWKKRIPESVAAPDSAPRSFDQAGPIQPEIDIDRLLDQKIHSGVYLIGVGDILQLQMPAVLRTLTTDYTDALGQIEDYICRVSPQGTITAPILGEVRADGLTLSQLEQRLINGYYPRYMVRAPVVVVSVREYQTGNLTILGGVKQPGVYACNSREMSVVSLIMKAGGMVDDGARTIRIGRPGATPNGGVEIVDRFVLPVKGINIPFNDVVLRDGDVVEIEKLNPEVFTVIGLVNRTGSFPYPPGVRYNLLQALAFAGGVNDLAAPQYVRIYRQDDGGEILSASFRLKGSTPVDGPAVEIRPGDVVAVEHDFSTRTRLLLAQIFRVTAGVNVYATYKLDTEFDDATTR